MIYLYFIENDFRAILPYLGIFSILCLLVMSATFIDLGFGIYESKKEGIYTHSAGLKSMVTKLSTYLSFLVLAFFIDAVNPIFIYWDAPHAPIVSILMALFLLIVEFISVREHVSDGTRQKFREAPKEVRDMVDAIKDFTDDIKTIKDNFESNSINDNNDISNPS